APHHVAEMAELACAGIVAHHALFGGQPDEAAPGLHVAHATVPETRFQLGGIDFPAVQAGFGTDQGSVALRGYARASRARGIIAAAGAEPEVAAFGVDYLGRREIQAEPEGLRLFPARGSEEGAQSVGEDPKVVVIENPGLDYGRPPHVFVADRVAEEKV